MPYSFVISTWKRLNPAMDVANLVRDCRPPPPTPTKSALPKGCLMMRLIRKICCAAYVKRTRCIGLLVWALNSLRPSCNMNNSLVWSAISSYLQVMRNRYGSTRYQFYIFRFICREKVLKGLTESCCTRTLSISRSICILVLTHFNHVRRYVRKISMVTMRFTFLGLQKDP